MRTQFLFDAAKQAVENAAFGRQGGSGVPDGVRWAVFADAQRESAAAGIDYSRLTAELSSFLYTMGGIVQEAAQQHEAARAAAARAARQAEQIRESRQAVRLRVDQAAQVVRSMLAAEPATEESRMLDARLREAAEHPRQPWWPRPPAEAPGAVAYGAVAVPPRPPYAPAVVRGGGRGLRVLVAFLTLAVIALAAAVVMIATRSPRTPASNSSTGPGATAATQPSTGTGTGSSTSPGIGSAPASEGAASPSAGEGPGGSGWAVIYHDVKLTLPTSGGCGGAGADFDIPSGFAVSADDAVGSGDKKIDLAVVNCGDLNAVEVDAHAWGKSSAQKPSPDQCQHDAERNALAPQIDSRQLTTGTGYCLITRTNDLVWFKIAAKNTTEGLVLEATRWKNT
ncbi:hypothetical protein [Kitasatospora cineracea]|uniref:hypothetical protein n=1 Tax=Kitasatospora cineracea TaxID=88074 RepID=UPI003798BEAF